MPTGFTMVDAGVLTEDESALTPGAKTKFIKDVKEMLMIGSADCASTKLFPCGPEVPPNPFADMLQLEDEKKFPDFHKNILGSYFDIAKKMNVQSNLSLLPICCPISFALKLGIKIEIPNFPGGFISFLIPNLPGLALKLNIMPPPKLALKIPGVLGIPPKLPDFKLELPKIPDFDMLFKFKMAFVLGMPDFMLNLVAKIPELALKLPNLPALFSLICDLAFKAKLFGDIAPDAIVQIVATKVLMRRVVEMAFIDAVGVTLGSSPGGITGGLGKFLGYQTPPADKADDAQTPRDKIVKYANACVDMKWSDASKDSEDDYVKRLLYVEVQDPAASGTPDPRAIGYDAAKNKCSEMSSCGMFARACLYSGGASYVFTYKGQPQLSKVKTKDPNTHLWYDFFQDEYRIIGAGGIAISGIIQAAKAKDAIIKGIPEKVTGDLPPLKKGDIIIIYNPNVAGKEHVMVVAEDYNGGFGLKTIEGGQSDAGNKSRPTAILKKEYVDAATIPKDQPRNQPPYGMYAEYGTNEVVIGGRKVMYVIDGEKICTSDKGSNMSTPAGDLDTSVAKDANDDTDNSQFLPAPT